MFKKMIMVVLVSIISVGAYASEKSFAKQFGWPALNRADFNRLCANQGVPLFWIEDKNNNGTVEPNEIVLVGTDKNLSAYIGGGRFTDAFKDLYSKLVETKRKEVVLTELNFGSPRVVESDFRSASEVDRKFVSHMMKVARMIEDLYLQQMGSLSYLKDISPGDAESLTLFKRNHGPWCETPKVEGDPFCNALSSFPQKLSDAYPKGMIQDSKMCQRLKSQANGKELMDPFKVIRNDGGRFVALPLTSVYGDKMKDVATELKAAADDLGDSDPKLKTYMLAAAKGFETNDWVDADEAWVSMNSRNSKWFLRVAPDETYFDPCQEKAGFQFAFAKIDKKSLVWQDKLNPLKDEMEKRMADLIGPPYQARNLSFNFPDFIEIILNSGDSKVNIGAIIGESLPNWGKVAQEGRGRTVVMTNLYVDPDSIRATREKASLLLDGESMKYFADDKGPSLLGTILHEATHNFGPYSDYKINGKNPSEIFGGRTSSTLEELKAEVGGLWYVDFLKKKGVISEAFARQVYVSNLSWCFGHISDGMFTAEGKPKPYAQLAAIEIGLLVQEGALSWSDDSQMFHVDFDKMPQAIEKIIGRTGRIMANADVVGAKAIVEEFVSGSNSRLVHIKEIQDRLLKFPKVTFDYSVQY